MKIFISSAIEQERLFDASRSSNNILYGRAHYSWKIVAQMYYRALHKMHLDVLPIVSPDIYQSPEARSIMNIGKDDIHITVKPIEHIRPMHGANNFFVCGWEFPEFTENPVNNNPAFNFISTLRKADKILCWSSFSVENLNSYGIDSAVALPPPVYDLLEITSENVEELNCFHYDQNAPHDFQYSTVGHVRKEYDIVFFMVMNPWDRRKNFSALIHSFSDFEQKNPEKKCALFIKLIVDNINTIGENIIEIMKVYYGIDNPSKNIFFTGLNLKSTQMMGFYKLFDFYICPSSTEGLNLPLIEAMAVGMVPISSAATAMQDYITADNAVVMPVERAQANAHFSALADAITLSHFPPSRDTLAKAFDKASNLSIAERAKKAKKANGTVSERYGMARFEQDFRRIVGQ